MGDMAVVQMWEMEADYSLNPYPPVVNVWERILALIASFNQILLRELPESKKFAHKIKFLGF